MKIALVYDHVNRWGGAERVLLALHEIWPQAPLFTSVYHPQKAFWAKDFQVKTSFLQKWPLAKSFHQLYPLLMPVSFESFVFDDFDIVISVSAGPAKGIITKPKTLHICYCLTPTRYLWSGYSSYFDSPLKRFMTKALVDYLREWDKTAAYRPDEILAISSEVQKRIKNFYHRPSRIIYPPVDTTKFQISEKNIKKESEEFFLIVSRLVKYKKIDIAIEAFNRLGWKLKIVGTGEEYKNLKNKAASNIEFLGQLTDSDLLHYYQKCEAVIFPQEEDFGIVPLEAQACGKPVIAYRGGGALETIIEGKTGEFFFPQTVEELQKKLLKFKKSKYKKEDCVSQAKKFSKERFKKEFSKTVEELWQQCQQN